MAKVERLSDELITKIAAGEVVERPASVVKELVENALDAGAHNVQIEIEQGGKSLVRVRDDGSGMSRADAALCVERHATSKLHALADLQSIATNGFRGEALASMGGVAQLRLVTRPADSNVGTEVEVVKGKATVRDAGHPRGTTVEVRDLFSLVPARKKFLRADSTETGHVAESVTLLALSRPDVGFVLESRGRKLIEAPVAGERGARIYQLFGRETLEGLAPMSGGVEWARVTGFVTRPAHEKAAARASVRIFVNGRPVRDRGLMRALSEGYRRAGQAEARGAAFLFVEVPRELLDVNVHPAKTEVRFADARTVWEAVTRAVTAALSEDSRARVAGRSALAPAQVAEPTQRYLAVPGEGSTEAAPAPQPPMLDEAGPTVLGQHRNTYIVATDGQELLLVDQHTAHERVRFEALLQGLSRRAAPSQRLLLPVVVEPEPRLRPHLEAHADTLAELGFEIEPFGGGSFRVAAVPALLGARDPGPALEALLADLAERDSTEWIVTGDRERLAATLACHSSTKAGEPLSREQMGGILRGLLRTAHPTQCPHGRPTLVRIPREDVTRWFGRSSWRRQ